MKSRYPSLNMKAFDEAMINGINEASPECENSTYEIPASKNRCDERPDTVRFETAFKSLACECRGGRPRLLMDSISNLRTKWLQPGQSRWQIIEIT